MSKLSDIQDAIARNNYNVILQRLSSVGNGPVAEAINKDESVVSRMKPDAFQQFAVILSVLDLKIVSTGMRCFKQSDVEFFMYGSKKWHEHLQSADDLIDED